MPPAASGRDSRRGSQASITTPDAERPRGQERREKAKSAQLSASASGASYARSRRGSRQELSVVAEAAEGKSRTRSAPFGAGRTQQINARTGAPSNDAGDHQDEPDACAGDQDPDELAGAVGIARSYEPFQSPKISEPIQEINIAVVGATGVGKSTFIQKALDLPVPSGTAAVEQRVLIDGSVYLLRLLELPIDEVEIDDDDTVTWPDTIESNIMPKVDGALTLYDVRDKDSLEEIPNLLSAIAKASLPSILVSCKCDTPTAQRQIDPAVVEQKARTFVSNIKTIQTSYSSSESIKRGISIILQAIMQGPAQIRDPSHRRAHSNVVQPVSPRPPSTRGHSRTDSEYSGGLIRDSKHSRHDSEYSRGLIRDSKHSRHDSSLGQSPSGDKLNVPQESAEDEMHKSFFLEESAGESSQESPRLSPSNEAQPKPGATILAAAASADGTTFDALVDRLLAQPMSKADHKFAAVFLALYRNFVAPGRLLEAIAFRFDALDRQSSAEMAKLAAQLRYLSILEQWVSTYPGDFAHPKTKRRIRTFVAKLASKPIFAVAAKEMGADLELVAEDDDTNWAFNDADREEGLAESTSDQWPMSSTATMLIDDPSEKLPDNTSGLTVLDDFASMVVTTGSEQVVAPRLAPTSLSSANSQMKLNVESAQRHAALLQPTQRYTISKFEWHQLYDFPDDAIARELTRIDWIMFSAIRPRDVVRQVSLTAAEKSKCRNLVHLNRMIDHFNFVASWCANFILFRDKPKHRALMLEKFIRIARKLRELNNYNALGAILAGVRNNNVHRLSATRELVSPAAAKDSMKLEILMSPSRSHFAYRLAWENSSSERIPYLPLHLRDLVSVEQGNKTFVGEEKDCRIDWRKFEIMGEIIVAVQRAQGLPYKNLGGWRGNEEIRSLVLDGKLVMDDELLYERSTQVEAPATSTKASGFREFFKR